MPFRWVYKEPEDGEAIPKLQEELGIPEKIAYLLSLRGIDTFDKAKNFFRPDLDLLHDPFLMKDMEEASTRLAKAIRAGEKILVYGDYDVDGTTATSILYIFLKDFGVDVEYFIPHRFKDGYGISPEGIQFARKRGAKLIVSVDCGITAVEEAKMAASQGIDLIICDHHNVSSEIPEAVGVLESQATRIAAILLMGFPAPAWDSNWCRAPSAS
ncbi:MAG: DHH family phosphoesterase [Balneolaceae bacterium]|nr:DHH family phosphoesterase [Balneolaceae bacterium]